VEAYVCSRSLLVDINIGMYRRMCWKFASCQATYWSGTVLAICRPWAEEI